MPQVSIEILIEEGIKGNLISFPTDTVPALAVRPDQASLIFQVKQRQLDKPLILMGAEKEDLYPYLKANSAEMSIWERVMEEYWPGGLTLILPASTQVPLAMNPLDSSTIGVRVPHDSLTQKILAQTGPLGTTSANLSGHPPLETPGEIEKQFPQVFILEASQWYHQSLTDRIPSTVAKWTCEGWQILRQGTVKLKC